LSASATSLIGGKSRLLIPTRELYLGGGHPIGEGIEPDIRVLEEEWRSGGMRSPEVLRVQYSPQVHEYIHKNHTLIKNLYAEGDLWDPAAEPGFEELHNSLPTTLTRSQVSHAVRVLIWRHLEDEQAEEITGDYVQDRQLARAILELLARTGREPQQIPEYAGITPAETTSDGDP
jgi:hypothetical protein